ncbi:MAG: PD-(D/E)XK nuclease family protein [Gemmatimonadota bacterium]|nr:PD-(D/E)XK nuclease family protein [Gemmatimonadota bacterium]
MDSLARIAKSTPVGRKLLVCPNMAAGRELLRRLSLERAGWIGFEVTTPSRLAHRMAQAGLERAGAKVLDTFDHQAVLDEALDSALAADRGGLGELSEGVGFREKVHGAINAMRLAPVSPRDLDEARFSQWEKKLFLLRVLQRYERLLMERRRADPAAVLLLALSALEEAGGTLPPALDADSMHLTPGLKTRGLEGRLVAALGARGAKLLETDPVVGIDAPEGTLWGRTGDPSPGSCLHAVDALDAGAEVLSIDFFSAASLDTELREVLRRVMKAGLSWDQVEIVTADPEAYGSGLHALAVRMGIPVTYAVGLPVGRTRTGRVVQAYLDWIEEGFLADPVRRLLEAGDLRPPRSRGTHAPAALARRFRSLRIGWGRQRYRSQIREALSGVDRMERRTRESAEGFERRSERARAELESLRSILFPALKATPSVPDRLGVAGDPVSPAELARGLGAFLRRVPRGRGPDRYAREEIGRILERIEATLTRRTEFRSSVAILRSHLDIRVRPELVGDDPDGAGAPWASAGGALHLSDLEHGGYTGRRAVFLVGLDAERVPGQGGQDPVLLDSDRRVLGTDLPTSAETLRDRIFRLAALVARLRGSVTMSYCCWQPTEARRVAPSSFLLQALRLTERDDSLTFTDLHARMGRVVSAIPPVGSASLDRDDVWMIALGSDEVMRRGVDTVRSAFPFLDSGLTALTERRTGAPGAVHGVISPRPDVLDPRRDPSAVVSASRLESLGACPLRYLHHSVLRAYPPDDPELDPDRWLDHRDRGTLLHRVYDAVLRDAKSRGVRFADRAFEVLALDALRTAIEALRHEVPIPGEGTFAREVAALRDDVRSFVRMVRAQGPEYVALEFTFGVGDEPSVPLSLGEGTVELRGAIDRVDQDLEGIHVVDYKTGGAFGYGSVVFNGGRRLQHALYAHAAETRLGGDVVDGQYHFPTRKGQNQAFVYSRDALEPVGELVELMLDGLAAGHFVPTDNADDCTFCDYAPVCRARRGAYGKTESPLAAWAEEHLNTGLQPAFAHLKKVRTFED